MSQAKFINVFGQWMHPDFEIFNTHPKTEEKITTIVSKIGNTVFKNKTIDEVAEEYNRQIDIVEISQKMMQSKVLLGEARKRGV